MKWERLLTGRRLSGAVDRQDGRTPFERDVDRIIFTGAFRRLADKTQVFPVPTDDHIHSRLTHSLEAASIGRSLGCLAGESLREAGLLPKRILPSDVGRAVEAACLAHDIGNPPFGHVGEGAIREFFADHRSAGWFRGLSPAMKADLLAFEANAQAFALVCRSERASDAQGLDLSLLTLGALIKYPCGSLEVDRTKGVHRKKYGFFARDVAIMRHLAGELGLTHEAGTKSVWARHPMAFVTEAADDIAYRLLDLEDGLRLGVVPREDFGEVMVALLGRQAPKDISKLPGMSHQDLLRVAAHARGRAVHVVVGQVAEAFRRHLPKLAGGKLKTPLLAELPSSEALVRIEKLNSSRSYRSRDVLKMEMAGVAAIKGVMGRLIEAALGADDLVSARLRDLLPTVLPVEGTPAERILQVTGHVSGMTDGYVLRIYRELYGIRLPGDRA